jgi:hypothetical protein
MSSIDLIERGLQARQQRGGSFNRTIVTSDTIEATRQQFDEPYQHHQSALRSIQKALTDFDEKAARRVSEYRNRPGGDPVDGAIRQRRSNKEIADFGHTIHSERSALLRSLFQSMATELSESRIEMNRLAAAVRTSAPNMMPLKLASQFNIGSDRRARLLAECSILQPATLKSMAEMAVANNDRELASVCIHLNDTKNAKDRSFSSQELADQVFGEHHRACHAHVNAIVDGADSAHAAERQLESGRTDSWSTIEAALNARDIG